MSKTIISLKDEKAETIIKEAKKKAIDCNLSFSDAAIQLLDKWVSDEIQLSPRENRKGAVI
jgi:hypothetical protein